MNNRSLDGATLKLILVYDQETGIFTRKISEYQDSSTLPIESGDCRRVSKLRERSPDTIADVGKRLARKADALEEAVQFNFGGATPNERCLLLDLATALRDEAVACQRLAGASRRGWWARVWG